MQEESEYMEHVIYYIRNFHSDKYSESWTHKGGAIHIYPAVLFIHSSEERAKHDARVRAEYNISPAFRTYGWTVRGFETYDDYEREVVATIQRVLTANPDLALNEACPVCGRFKRTPNAKQCMWCLSGYVQFKEG